MNSARELQARYVMIELPVQSCSMLDSWKQKYLTAVAEATKSSQFGAFVIVIMVLVEAFSIIRAAAEAENYTAGAVYQAVMPVVLFAIAFGLRFGLLFNFATNVAIRSITWWSIVLVVWFCLYQFGPSPGAFYSLFHSFPLQVAGMFFVLAGAIRFIYFGSVALRHDLNTNS